MKGIKSVDVLSQWNEKKIDKAKGVFSFMSSVRKWKVNGERIYKKTMRIKIQGNCLNGNINSNFIFYYSTEHHFLSFVDNSDI